MDKKLDKNERVVSALLRYSLIECNASPISDHVDKIRLICHSLMMVAFNIANCENYE